MLASVAMALVALFNVRVALAQETIFDMQSGTVPSRQIGIFSLDQSQRKGFRLFYSTAQYPNALIQYTRLVVGPHGWPRSYLLQAGIQGRSIRIRVIRRNGVLLEKISQGSTVKRYRFPLTEPVDFVDNNDLAGLQALLDRLDGKVTRGEKIRVFVPQAIGFGTLLVEKSANGKMAIGRKRQAVRFLHLRLQVRKQRAPIRIASNPATHQLLQFSQLKTSVQITAKPNRSFSGAKNDRHCAVRARRFATFVHGKSRSELMLPVTGREPWPALLLISSTQDLAPSSRWPWRTPMISIDEELANGLACRGIATLLFSQASTQRDKSPRTALRRHAEGIASALTLLADQPGVDPNRVFLAGNAIGGLLALYTLSGLHPEPSGLILIDTPGKPLQDVLTQSLVESSRREGAPTNRLVALRRRLKQYFRRAAQNGVSRRFIEISPVEPYGHLTNILLGILTLHPADLVARAHLPILIVQGKKDLAVLPDNELQLSKAAPNAQHITLAEMTHSLVTSRLPPLSAALTKPDQRVDVGLIRVIARWIKGGSKGGALKTASNRASY